MLQVFQWRNTAWGLAKLNDAPSIFVQGLKKNLWTFSAQLLVRHWFHKTSTLESHTPTTQLEYLV